MIAASDATRRARGGLTEYLLLGAVCWTLFVNHYARDVTGALELQIMTCFGIGSESLQLLNSVYFAPSFGCPILVGALAHRFGGASMLVVTTCVAAVGNMLIAMACTLVSYDAMLVGRLMMGCVYEAIDILPLPILAPYYLERWGLLMGTRLACLRLGSVATFTFSPLLHQVGGLPAATWTACALGSTGLFAACTAFQLQRRHLAGAFRDEKEEAQVEEEEEEEMEEKRRQQQQQQRQRQEEEDATDVESKRSCMGIAKDTPCGELARFVAYLSVGTLIWGCIAPWWFFGQGYISDRWHESLQVADALMLLPEATMAILSPAVGLIVDRLPPRTRVASLASCLCGVIAAFALLTFQPPSDLTPLVPMAILGLGYASSVTIFMSLSAVFIPKTLMALGSGALGCSLNLGPAVLPVIMGSAESPQAAMMWLLGIAALAMLAALVLLVALTRGALDSKSPTGDEPALRPTRSAGAEQTHEVQAV